MSPTRLPAARPTAPAVLALGVVLARLLLATAASGQEPDLSRSNPPSPVDTAPLYTVPSWSYESNQLFAHLGASVATAGDVNGDGRSDVIVGAPQYDNGQDLEGRALVFHGTSGGLSVTADWIGESNTTNARFGNAVAAAGDVNGDGYADVLVGAYAYSNGQTSEGRVYLYLGSALGLANAPAWTFESNQIGGWLGTAVATAGDVNGDGYADVIVGASLYDNGEVDEGRAYVFHGSAAGPAATPSWTAESNQGGAEFGVSVCTAGDVNGDGYADVVVGASGYTNGQSSEGAAFLFYGSAAGLESAAGWVVESNVTSAFYGQAVATAGDVNGDGYADVVIGAPRSNGALPRVGAAYVYAGSATGLSTSAQWSEESSQSDSDFGAAVGTAGDVNGDGFSDVLVGSYRFDNGQGDEGQALAYLGTAERISTLASWTAEGNLVGADFGQEVASAGDVNGDGYGDVIVGAQAFANGEEEEGAAFVFLGSATGLALTPVWRAEGNQLEARFGSSVDGAGDVNGDGYDDIIVGATHYENGQTREGRAYVYHGSPTGPGSQPAWIAEPNRASAYFGASVAGAGDVNGDGYADVIVGARVFTNDQANEGRAFIYRGSPSGLGATAFWTVEADQANAEFGQAVAGAGDVNRDGYSDVIVGAPAYQNGEIYEGRAFVYLGAPGTPSSIPVWTGESNEDVSFYGRAVQSAGDLNGDGFSDIIVGAPNYDNVQQNVGRVWVHNGSPSGPNPYPVLVLTGDQPYALLGEAVSTAGDIDGDGLSDILIGAPGYDNDQMGEGRAWVYLGFSAQLRDPQHAALVIAPAWVGEGNLASAYFGTAVASAGDVNGDGFPDLLIGAAGFTNGEIGEGRTFMFYGGGGDGLDRRPRQARTDDSAAIGILGRSNAETAVRLKATGRTPAGRGRVRLEYEIDLADTPFDGLGIVTGPWANTGAPGAAGSAVPLSTLASGLPSGALHHWRLRVRTDSPHFPNSRWLSLPQNSVTEADFRTRGAVGVGDPETAPSASAWLGPITPNPFASEAVLAYRLSRAGRHRLTVFDVQGRVTVVLADRFAPAGNHAVRWDGLDERGNGVPAGVYFVRLDAEGLRAAQKLVRISR